MTVFLMYLLAIISLAIGTGAISLTMIQTIPIKWIHIHYFIRKPVNWSIVLILVFGSILSSSIEGEIQFAAILPILLSFLALVLTYKMHQENVFETVYSPTMSDFPEQLPLRDEQLLAVIKYDGVTKCYPLDYVIHHHIVNDQFGTKTVSLTYCAMCRSITAYDVTEIGPLFGASFKNANMVLSDVKTKTFFQQATSQSMVGKLHPHDLTMISYQIMTWSDVLKNISPLLVSEVTIDDLKEFEIPIPGAWKKLMMSEITPGMSKKNKDKTMPARTHVIGILDLKIGKPSVYIKSEVLKTTLVKDPSGFILLAYNGNVNGFMDQIDTHFLDLDFDGSYLIDKSTNTRWNVWGKNISGTINQDLIPISISDEYWFSWKFFHGEHQLKRL